MKGYYVIPTEGEPIEFTGKNARNRAIKLATELFNKGDQEVFVHQFDDNDSDGYFANGEIIFVK